MSQFPPVLATALALGLALGPGAVHSARRVPLARRLKDTLLARDLLEGRQAPSLSALRSGGEEVSLGIPGRWGGGRFELVRAEGPEGDGNLLAFDHKARRWWRLDACGPEEGPLELRRSLVPPDDTPGTGLITRCPEGPLPNYAYFRLGPRGAERLTRFSIPWAELDREVLAGLHAEGLGVTSADTSWMALSTLEDLDPEHGGGRTSWNADVYVGRLEEYTHALDHADPTLGLTAREMMLTRDWLPPGVVRVTFNLLPGMVRVGEVGAFREEKWVAPRHAPDLWVLPRPRPESED